MTAGPARAAAIARAASRGPCGGREPGGRPGRALLDCSAPSLLRHHPAGPRRRSHRYWRGRAALFVSSSASAPWARGGGWDAQGRGSAGAREGTETGSEGAGTQLGRGPAQPGSEDRLRVGDAGRRGAVGALRMNFTLQDRPEAAGRRAERGPAMGSSGLSSLPVPAGSAVPPSFAFAVVGGRQGPLVQPSVLLRERAGAAGPPVACASGARGAPLTSGRRGAGPPGLCGVPARPSA